MQLQEFINKYNGKFVEVGGSANAINQCVDLANAYINEVLGLPMIFWTNAKDFPAKAGDKYEFIKNTPTGVPQPGDIMIWKYAALTNPGHIAIFVNGNVNTFNSFDQNYPLGSKAHIQSHNYSNVAGWLRAKKQEVGMLLNSQQQADFYQAYLDRPITPGEVIPNGRDALEFFISARAEITQRYKALKDGIASQNKTITDLQVKLETALFDVEAMKGVASNQQKQIDALNAQVAINQEDTKQLNAVGELLKWFITRIGQK